MDDFSDDFGSDCKTETTTFTTDDGEYYYPLCTECG